MKEQLKHFLKLAGGAVLLALLWKFPGKFVQDAALWGFFLYAVGTGGARWRVWWTPWGWIALAILALTLLLTPWGADPKTSFRLLIKKADIVAACLALPVALHRRSSIAMVLWSAALALSAALIFELAQILSVFGADAMSKARWSDPVVFTHHNIGAMAAAVSLILLTGAGLIGRRRPIVWMVCAVAGLALIAYIVIIGSRGPQIALLAGWMAFGVISITRRWFRFGVVLALVMVGACLPVINPRFQDTSKKGMLVERDKVWQHTWKLISEKPATGYGYGEPVFQKVYQNSKPPRSPHTFFHPHNYWLNALFIGGWGLAILHAALWGLGLVGLWRAAGRSPEPEQRLLVAAVAAVLVCILVYGVVDTPTNVVSMMLLLMAPVIALLISPAQTT